MDLIFSAEQRELRAVVRAFLREHSSETAVRAQLESGSGFDPHVWALMSGQLGLQGLAVPERFGGAGAGAVETGVVLEEMGAVLYGGPFLSTCVLAVQAVLAAGDDGCARELLPGIAEGVTTATLAFRDEPAPVVARSGGGGRILLDGVKNLVVDGAGADLLLVLAEGEGGARLYAVASDAEGLVRTPLQGLDGTRRLARLEFAGTPAYPVGGPGAGGRILRHVLDHARVALAAEAVGGTQWLLDTAVAHAKTRVQFGAPIGSFQAVQHACAALYVDLESARALAHQAMWHAAAGAGELGVSAALAKAECLDAYMRSAAETIQLLGGIGVTWEHPAHLYFRRAKSSQLLFGGSDEHRDLAVERLSGVS